MISKVSVIVTLDIANYSEFTLFRKILNWYSKNISLQKLNQTICVKFLHTILAVLKKDIRIATLLEKEIARNKRSKEHFKKWLNVR